MANTKQAAGGRARAANLSPAQRSAIARKAAEIRWTADLPEADFEGSFEIGGKTVSAAVLRDERRIITQSTFLRALGRSRSPKAGTGVLSTVDELPVFLRAKALKSFINNELILSTKPVFYRTKSGSKGVGYDATLVRAVADVYLKFRDHWLATRGSVPVRYLNMIGAAEAIKTALADVGIIALVDEATGYQDVRNRHALQDILDAYLRKALAAWAKRFPDEFYRQIYRLRGWEWKGRRSNPPQVVARYTTDFVYERLAPGICKELERRMPRTLSGNRKGKLHQLFTDDIGHPALAQHIHAVITLMKASQSWNQFKLLLDRSLPKRGNNLQLPFVEDA